MFSLLIETDLGRDADDLFALLYLLESNTKLHCIFITPGDEDQIALAKFILKECNVDVPVFPSKTKRKKESITKFHKEVLYYYEYPLKKEAENLSYDIIENLLCVSELEAFICGPPHAIGDILKDFPEKKFNKITIQGGFISYEEIEKQGIRPEILEKFKGRKSFPSFNLNGSRKGTEAILNSKNNLYFVSKNVCHKILFDKDIYKKFKEFPPKTRAGELFREIGGLYIKKYENKIFHDPTAAVCCKHSNVPIWLEGELKKESKGWLTKVCPNGPIKITADIDKSLVWDYLIKGI